MGMGMDMDTVMGILRIFNRKRNISDTALLEGMTDIHCHILPGVDDGVKTMEESVESLQRLQQTGVRQFYLTPHIMSDLGNEEPDLQVRFRELQEAAPEGIELRLAAEYMLDKGFERHREHGLLAMKDRHVLVETSYMSPPPEMQEMLYEAELSGYQVILAHPERYAYMEKEDYLELKKKGVGLQMNLLSLGGYYGRSAQKKCQALLKLGIYDYIGSDFHSLKKHNYGLSLLNLTSTQIKQIGMLLENNVRMW